MPAPSKINWARVKKEIKTWEQDRLIELVHDLFELSLENRDFFGGRFLARTADGSVDPAILESYRKKIGALFYTRSGLPKDQLKLGEGRRIIAAYSKACNDVAGRIRLMLAFVGDGIELSREFGDINADYYTALENMLHEAAKELAAPECRDLYLKYRELLQWILETSRRFGYGFDSNVASIIYDLRDAVGDPDVPKMPAPTE